MSFTVTNVHDLARSFLAETASEMWTDAALLPFTQEAFAKAQRALRTTGMGIFRKESSAIVVTAGQTTISRTGPPTLPTDLVRPLELRERPTGTGYYALMSSSDGFIPDEAATSTVSTWDWRDDTIYLHACSATVDIQIQYEAALPAITVVGSTITIPDALGPMAKMVASMAARSRDEKTHTQDWWAQAMEDLAQIAENEKRVKTGRGARIGSK